MDNLAILQRTEWICIDFRELAQKTDVFTGIYASYIPAHLCVILPSSLALSRTWIINNMIHSYWDITGTSCVTNSITCTCYSYRGIFPHAISFLRRAPVIGIVLNLPGISRVSKYIINTYIHTSVFTVSMAVG